MGKSGIEQLLGDKILDEEAGLFNLVNFYRLLLKFSNRQLALMWSLWWNWIRKYSKTDGFVPYDLDFDGFRRELKKDVKEIEEALERERQKRERERGQKIEGE